MSHDAALDEHILNIIWNHEILEQSELQKLLKKRGYDIPQATLSRHLKRLKIAKVSGIYQTVSLSQANLPLVLSMDVSEFGLIVLRTHPGNANSLGYFFDQKYVTHSSKIQQQPGILGTIAGDDTLLLIVRSKADVGNILSEIYAQFPYLREE